MHRPAHRLSPAAITRRIAGTSAAAALLAGLTILALSAPAPCFAAPAPARPAAEDRIVPVSFLSFHSKVLAAEMPVLVDFSAPWCIPCKAIERSLAAVAAAAGGRVKVVRVNVSWSHGLAKRYGVEALPTLLVFDHGTVVERATGALSIADIRDLIAGSVHVAVDGAAAEAATAIANGD